MILTAPAFWALVPVMVMGGLVVATAPVWPYSRGWSWNIAGMSAVGMLVAGMFALAWLGS